MRLSPRPSPRTTLAPGHEAAETEHGLGAWALEERGGGSQTQPGREEGASQPAPGWFGPLWPLLTTLGLQGSWEGSPALTGCPPHHAPVSPGPVFLC